MSKPRSYADIFADPEGGWYAQVYDYEGRDIGKGDTDTFAIPSEARRAAVALAETAGYQTPQILDDESVGGAA